MNEKIRKYNIDFLRFALAIMVVLYHFSSSLNGIYHTDLTNTLAIKFGHCGFGAVPAFFFISGFFLYQSVKNKPNQTFLDFFANKIFRLWPVLAGATLLNLIFNGNYIKHIDTLNLLFINSGTGLIKEHCSNQATWFIGVLFFLSIFFRHIILKLSQKDLAFFSFIILFLSFSVINKYSLSELSYSHVLIPTFGLTSGMLIGLGSISFGIIAAIFYENIQRIKYEWKIEDKIILNIAEIGIFAYFCNGIIYRSKVYENMLFWLILFCAVFLFFMFKKGILSNFFNNKLSFIAGRYSYCLFVVHLPVIVYFIKHQIYSSLDVLQAIVITLAAILSVSVIMYHLVEIPIAKLLKKIYEKHFIEKFAVQ